jgi:hypothetical protein
MASGFQITCANKNPNGIIVRVGGQGWSLSLHSAIPKISSGQLQLHIRQGDEYFDIGMRGDGTTAYLALEPDGTPLHEYHCITIPVNNTPVSA